MIKGQVNISGQFHGMEEREHYLVRNPANTEEIVASFPKLKREDVKTAIESAKNAFKLWSTKKPVERSQVLYKASQIIESKAEELAILLTKEEGKPIADSMFEIIRTINLLRFYGTLITQEAGRVIPSQDNDTFIFTRREPLGVVGIITPWNFPLSLPAWKIIPALATGNTVVWKPASITPTIGMELVKIFYEAGLPSGVLNYVTGSGNEVGDEIITNEDVDGMSFTGSLEVGKDINKKVGNRKRFTRLQLELGGKNAVVLTKNGNINLAIEQVVRSAFGVTGQACTATSRFIVPEDIAETVLNKLIERTKKLAIGNGLDKGIDMGPLASQEQLDKYLYYVELGKKEGAKLVYGGNRLVNEEFKRGYFVEPTIFDRVSPDMRIAKEEIFAPVISVLKYKTLDEAIEIVNGIEYGLVAGIITNDPKEMKAFMENVKVGVVKINKPTIGLEPWVPYGGVKSSGNDVYKEMGVEAINFYTTIKAVYQGY